MKLQTVKCPNCDKDLQLEDDVNSFFCKHCGQKIVLEAQSAKAAEESHPINVTQPQENVNSLQSSNAKSTLDERKLKLIIIGSIALAIFIVIRVLVSMGPKTKLNKETENEMKGIENQVVECINEGDYDKALLYANQLRIEGDYSISATSKWDEKREKYISYLNIKLYEDVESVDVGIPFSSKYAQKKKYDDIVQMLRDAGYMNITLSGVEDTSFFKKRGRIEKISVDGKTKFDEGDVFKSDVKIIVYYLE